MADDIIIVDDNDIVSVSEPSDIVVTESEQANITVTEEASNVEVSAPDIIVVQGTGLQGPPGTTNHGLQEGLLDDDHPQYSLVDGTRAFTGVVSGVTPTLSTHLTTKLYVDNGDASALASANAYTDTHEARIDNPHAVTAAQAGADPAGTAASALSTHEAASDPHPQYLRLDTTNDPLTGSLQVHDATDALHSGAYTFSFNSGVAASGTSVGFSFDTTNSMLATTGDTVFEFKDGGSELFRIYKQDSVGKYLRAAVNRGDFGVGGVANNITANGWAFGQGHTVSATNTVAFGQGNTVSNTYASAFGTNNVSGSSSGACVGQNNTTGSSYAFAAGFGNTATANGNVCLGLNQTAGSFAYNTCIGNSNQANGFACVSIGGTNVSTGFINAAVLIGNANTTSSSNVVGLGDTNALGGTGAVALGRVLNPAATSAVCLGSGVDSSNKLINATANSIMMGCNSTVATLSVSDGGGVGGLGNVAVGLGATMAGERLEVNGNVFLNTDSDKLLLGAGKDASAYYDGTDLIVNPKEVGSGRLDVLGDVVHDGYYGGFYQNEVPTSVTISVANTWYRITGNTVTFVNGMSFATDLLTIAANNGGKYLVNWSCSLYDGSGTQNFEVGVDVNGTVNASTVAHVTTKGITESETMAGSSILDLVAADTVGLMIRNTGAINNPTINHITFTLTWVGK